MRARIRRSIFAFAHIVTTALLWVVIVGGFLLMLGPCPPSSPPPEVGLTVLIASLVTVLLAVRLWLEVKRLHDIGWSGWWAVVALSLTIGPAFVPKIHDSFAWLPSALTLVWFLVLALKPGDGGANRFGAAPTSRFALFGSRTEPASVVDSGGRT